MLPQPVVAAPSMSTVAVDASAEVREALTRLETAADLSVLPPADRDALMGSLIRTLALVNTECFAATPHAIATAVQSTDSPTTTPPVTPPKMTDAPAATAPSTPSLEPATMNTGDSQDSASYTSPKSDVPAAAPTSTPAMPTAAGSVSLASTYYIEGMEQMGANEYREVRASCAHPSHFSWCGETVLRLACSLLTPLSRARSRQALKAKLTAITQ